MDRFERQNGRKMCSNAHFLIFYAKNQGYHQLIEVKLCMSYYSHKSMPDAKFESGSFSIFGDMTSL